MEQIWPPQTCRHCNQKGAQYFYRDTIQTETYRCRLCGTEHYKNVIDIKGSNPKVGGRDI